MRGAQVSLNRILKAMLLLAAFGGLAYALATIMVANKALV